MKKGFTLIELLGVITILALIALIALPAIEKTIQDGKEDLYNIQIKMIEAALKDYRVDNLLMMPKNNGDTLTLTLSQLKAEGKIDKDITNPKTDELFYDDMLLYIKKVGNNFEYIIDEDSGTNRNVFNNPDAPTISLKGNIIEYLTEGVPYIDQGVEAKTADDVIITGVSTEISGSDLTINPLTNGEYIIKYSVTDNDLTATVIRTVIVIPPI